MEKIDGYTESVWYAALGGAEFNAACDQHEFAVNLSYDCGGASLVWDRRMPDAVLFNLECHGL